MLGRYSVAIMGFSVYVEEMVILLQTVYEEIGNLTCPHKWRGSNYLMELVRLMWLEFQENYCVQIVSRFQFGLNWPTHLGVSLCSNASGSLGQSD